MKYWNIYSDADKKDKYTYVAIVDSCNEYIFLTRLSFSPQLNPTS